MDKKHCGKCGRLKPLAEYSKNASRPDGLNNHCKGYHKIARRKHYLRNQTKIRAQIKKYKVETSKMIRSIKAHTPCNDCEKFYPYYVMDFDHRPGEQKEFAIGAQNKSRGKQQLLKEIAKCNLVCANCHRERTYKRRIDEVSNHISLPS